MGWFNFDGELSTDYGVVVESCATRPVPARQQNVWSIPGRNGDFVRPLHDGQLFANVIQEYEVYLDCSADEWEDQARAFARMLLFPQGNAPTGINPTYNPAGSGYTYLTDSYDSSTDPCYRCAYFEGPMDIANSLMKFGRATVRFNCKPQRYLFSGAQPITLTFGSQVSLTNPTGLITHPVIHFSTQPQSFDLYFRYGYHYKAIIEYLGDSILDCENWMISSGSIKMPQDLQAISSYELPELDDAIRIDPADPGSVVGVYLYPRWWTV